MAVPQVFCIDTSIWDEFQLANIINCCSMEKIHNMVCSSSNSYSIPWKVWLLL